MFVFTYVDPERNEACRIVSVWISFQHILHFGVGRSQIEWNMKVKLKFQFVQV